MPHRSFQLQGGESKKMLAELKFPADAESEGVLEELKVARDIASQVLECVGTVEPVQVVEVLDIQDREILGA